jgi:hypothetical protein
MVNHPLHGERRVDAGRAGVPIWDTRASRGLSCTPRERTPADAPIVRILGKCDSFKFS